MRAGEFAENLLLSSLHDRINRAIKVHPTPERGSRSTLQCVEAQSRERPDEIVSICDGVGDTHDGKGLKLITSQETTPEPPTLLIRANLAFDLAGRIRSRSSQDRCLINGVFRERRVFTERLGQPRRGHQHGTTKGASRSLSKLIRLALNTERARRKIFAILPASPRTRPAFPESMQRRSPPCPSPKNSPC